jgi:hypothetical protein
MAAAAYGLAGGTGLWVFTCVWIGLFLVSLLSLVGKRCSLPYAGLLYAIVAKFSSVVWSSRPHVMALGLFSVWVWVILTSLQSRRPSLLWSLPLIQLVWANVHGSAPLGPALAGFAWLVSWWRPHSRMLEGMNADLPWRNRLGIATALSGVASLANPQGWRSWWYIVAASQHPLIVTFIDEWQPPRFDSIRFWPVLLGVLAVVALLAAKRGKARIPALEGLLALVFFFLSMRQARHVPYFYFSVALLLASLLGNAQAQREQRLSKAAKAVVAVCTVSVLTGAMLLYSPAWVVRKDGSSDYPVQAVEYVKNSGGMRVFNDYNWGGYLIWEGIAPFIDGRADMYVFGGDIFRDYIGATLPESSLRRSLGLDMDPGHYLYKHSVDTVLIAAGSSLDWFLRGDSRWQETYRDAGAVVFIRKEN